MCDTKLNVHVLKVTSVTHGFSINEELVKTQKFKPPYILLSFFFSTKEVLLQFQDIIIDCVVRK